MGRRGRPSPLDSLLDAPAVREAADALLDAVAQELGERVLSPADSERRVADAGRMRGRPLMLPGLATGPGRGARVRLADGSWKLDFIGGIGVYGFGHADRDLLRTAAAASAIDSVFQGHLLPGGEYLRLSRALLRHTGPRLRHCWLSVSGAIANENALKMILQKHHPADRLVVFEGAFAGRTTTLAEVTDKPGFREGLPLRGNVLHVPFFDTTRPDPIGHSLAALDAHLARYPRQIAGMLFELVQGEGGIRPAPRAFFAALMERCRESGMAVWVDEVQTFARTGELFAYRSLDLADYVDVATVGKMLQGSAVLFRKRYAPGAGLVSGTYAGSTAGMAVGARIIERLETEGYLGPDGGIRTLGSRVAQRFEALVRRCPRAVRDLDGIGAMQAFVALDGSARAGGALVKAAFEEGLLVFTAGANPTRIRLLLPVNTTDEELDDGFAMLEKALRRVSEEQGLPC